MALVTPRIFALGLLLAPLLVSGRPAPAAANEVCEAPPPSRGPVSLIILPSGSKVHELAKSVKDAEIVAQDEQTVVFADGRIITANPESAGTYINRLGWSRRRIDITATLPARRARPRRARG